VPCDEKKIEATKRQLNFLPLESGSVNPGYDSERMTARRILTEGYGAWFLAVSPSITPDVSSFTA